MNLVSRIQENFFKTAVFKTLLRQYVSQPDALVISKQTAKDQIDTLQKQTLPELVQKGVKEEIQKLETMNRNEAMRYRLPYNINTNTNPDFKPMGSVPFSYLRRMANTYPIARACINRRIRQITQLDWDVTTIDDIEDEKGFESQIRQVKKLFKYPMGHKTRFREFLTILCDDVLTIDAICFEMQKTRGGEFMHLIPVDPTTIALRVTETGGTPEPPDPAYVQFIQGQELNSFTTDEMIYDFMGTRSYSPYGLAPLESLILQVESAIRGALYNLNYFKEGNVPEGFIFLPEEVATTKTLVEEWQMWFDALVAGDPRFTHRLKILPGGTTYAEAKKPQDMAFEKFEMWLLQQTCAVFDVPPQDIGITYQVNKATSETQSDLSRERGLIPLGNFIKEVIDSIIQEELGLESLQFIWRNINPVDRKEEIEIAEKEIKIGAMSVDEYRIDQGREPIGLTHFIETSKGPIKVEDFISGKYQEMQQGPENVNTIEEDEDQEKLMRLDLKKWRKCVMKDIEAGRPLRTRFPSDYIDEDTHKTIQEALKKVSSKEQIKLLFDEYLDPEIRSSMTLLKHASELRRIERDFASA